VLRRHDGGGTPADRPQLVAPRHGAALAATMTTTAAILHKNP